MIKHSFTQNIHYEFKVHLCPIITENKMIYSEANISVCMCVCVFVCVCISVFLKLDFEITFCSTGLCQDAGLTQTRLL